MVAQSAAPAPGPKAAAEALFNDPGASVAFEAADVEDARQAVDHIGWLFDNAPGVFRRALDGARAGAQTLSGDPLQGIAEIIQNADDAGATFVRFQVIDDRLRAVHDGRPVTLSDVLSLATPWLSNKTEDVWATGRFGIGLMTLRSLSHVLDVHSGHYHLRLQDSTIAAIDADGLATVVHDPTDTVFCLPLRPGALDPDSLIEWLGRWDDSALLFCRHVGRVSVLDSVGKDVHTLKLGWSDDKPTVGVIDGHKRPISRRQAEAPDGRKWLVHRVDVPAPADIARVRKASGETVPLGVAIPLQPEPRGAVYAGLPVVDIDAPVRVNAQFDPITNRQGLAPTPWNDAMLPLIADLWIEVVEDLFAEMPIVAWDVVPLPTSTEDEQAPLSVLHRLEALLLDRARNELSEGVKLDVGNTRRPLAELAVEDVRLEGVIEPGEVAALAELPASLPLDAWDPAGRWRRILDDWRAGASLPSPVTVERALNLIGDDGRSATSTVALAAAALDSGLGTQLAALPCVITAAGTRIAPPTPDALQALVITASPLAENLGVGVHVADAYLADDDAARTVLAWLRNIGGVSHDADTDEVVRRLAAAGRAGRQMEEPLTDEQIRALRDAFEQMEPDQRQSYGRDVGMAISVAAFHYDSRGQRIATHARPADSYIPAAIDKEPDSFAFAADKTPGLLWIHRRYSESLRSSLGRAGGLGPQRFFRLLGAETAPRVIKHPDLYQRYTSDRRLGLGIGAPGSPPQRNQALQANGATYALDDFDSPDLRAVAQNIAKQRKALRRRDRAGALLGALGRAWDRIEDRAEVTAANDFYAWQPKGQIRAFWLWSVGAIPWLDDTDGVAQPPLDLRLRTPGTIAVHGAGAAGYLRPEFNLPNRREVLAALGVTGEPSTRDLIERLGELRRIVPEATTVATDAAVVYEALADRLASRTSVPGDLSERELRTAFGEGDGLIRTQLGWLPPTKVFSGPPIFRTRRAFVPPVRNTDPLWTALHVRQPSLDDCITVISEVSRTRAAPNGDDVMVLLETLRLLSTRLAGSSDASRRLNRRLAKVPLWTTTGWTTDRPVYAVDDPALAESLGDHVPVWRPGGELSQFDRLLHPLRITQIATDASTVVDPDAAIPDPDLTELLASAISLLQEDLARNDPTTAASLAVGWERLREFEVRIDSDLRVRVDGLVSDRAIEIGVATKADVSQGVLYLTDSRALRQVDGGGRAMAGLFLAADRRHLAQAWLAACIAADEGRSAQRLELAQQQAAEEEERNEDAKAERLAALGQEITDRHEGRSRRPTTAQGIAGTTPTAGTRPTTSPHSPKQRVLVDPATLTVVDSNGRVAAALASSGRSRKGETSRRSDSPLTPPNPKGPPPRATAAPTSFTAFDKETVGMELVRKVLGWDDSELADLRAQRGVGADAIDFLDRFFELKVHLGDEPDVIHLEESQIRRAFSTPDFFLVVVSNVEGKDARPKVRIIIDPVNELRMTETSSVNFTGVRSAEHCLVYYLERPATEDEQP